MKLLTFIINGQSTYGAVRDGGIVDIGARLGNRYPDIRAVLAVNALPELSSLLESLTPDYVAPDLEEIHNLAIRTRLNGEVMQDSNTCRLIFSIPAIIEYISAFTPLSAGDVIATGTPGGVGFTCDPPVYLKPGDEIVVDIEQVGSLVNPVVAGV